MADHAAAAWDEYYDSKKFLDVIFSGNPYVIQHVNPTPNPYPGALDTLVFKDTLLILYAYETSVVICLGTDMTVIKIINVPQQVIDESNSDTITALAFRPADAAIAVGLGRTVVILSGWVPRQPDNLVQRMWNFDHPEDVLYIGREDEQINFPVRALSWSRDCSTLAAVGHGVSIWSTKESNFGAKCAFRDWDLIFRKTSEECGGNLCLGKISPNGKLIAVSGLRALCGKVFIVCSKEDLPYQNINSDLKQMPSSLVLNPLLKTESSQMSGEYHDFVDLQFGNSGIAALDWKPRGGGNMALLTMDFDGKIRLWAKIPRTLCPSNWMQEVATCPHREGASRSSAAFVEWGGGGGVAEEELDSSVTTSSDPVFVQSSAPRPSRCMHWIVSATGGDIRAWKATGLDDRPRATYAKLEPGAVNMNIFTNSTMTSNPAYSPLSACSVVTIKAISPNPITSRSQQNFNLAKSYAIGNGEQRLRSSQPPNPPNLVACFSLSVKNGTASLMRWDFNPTSSEPPLLRSEITGGFSSAINEIDVIFSNEWSRKAFALVSRGISGDVKIWKVKQSYPPLSLCGVMSGPYSVIETQKLCPSSDFFYIFGIQALTGMLVVHKCIFEETTIDGVRLRHKVAIIRIATNEDDLPMPNISCLKVLELKSLKVFIIFGIAPNGSLETWLWKNDVTEPQERHKLVKLKILFDIPLSNIKKVSPILLSNEDYIYYLIIYNKEGGLFIYSLSLDIDSISLSIKHVCDLESLTKGCKINMSSIESTRHGRRIAAIQGSTLCVWERKTSTNWALEFKEKIGPSDNYVYSSIDIYNNERGEIYITAMIGTEVFHYMKSGESPWRKQGYHQIEGMKYACPSTRFLNDRFIVMSSNHTLRVETVISKRKIFGQQSLGTYHPLKGLSIYLWCGENPAIVYKLISYLKKEIKMDEIETAYFAEGDKIQNVFVPPPSLAGIFDQEISEIDLPECINGVKIDTEKLSINDLSLDKMISLNANIKACDEMKNVIPSLDKCGASFALLASTYLQNPLSSAQNLSSASVALAFHSSSRDALVNSLLMTKKTGKEPFWSFCFRMGAGWWVQNIEGIKALAEKLAREAFIATKDPEDSALWYIALGRKTALSALYRTQQNKKMVDFLARDFKIEANRVAAGKNAYVLLSKHKICLSVAFFILAGDFTAAISTLIRRAEDLQLAVIIARLIEQYGYAQCSNQKPDILPQTYSAIEQYCEERKLTHEKAFALWLNGKHDECLNVLINASTGLNDDVVEIQDDLVPISVQYLGHVLAASSRPPVRGTSLALNAILICRRKAIMSLGEHGHCSHALRCLVTLQNEYESDESVQRFSFGASRRAIIEIIKDRTSIFSQAFRNDTEKYLNLVKEDIDLLGSLFGKSYCLALYLSAAAELYIPSTIDCAMVLAFICKLHAKDWIESPKERRKFLVEANKVMELTIARSLYLAETTFTRFDETLQTLEFEVDQSIGLYKAAESFNAALNIITRNTYQGDTRNFIGDIRRTLLFLLFTYAYINNRWDKMCRALWIATSDTAFGDNRASRTSDVEINRKIEEFLRSFVEDKTSTNFIKIEEFISLEDLRMAASNPSVIRSAEGNSIDMRRKGPSIARNNVPTITGAKVNKNITTVKKVKDWYPVILFTLGASAAAALSAHLAFVCFNLSKSEASDEGEHDIVRAAERLESVTYDAVSGWAPLVATGVSCRNKQVLVTEEYAREFLFLWGLLSTIPELAVHLSEAATFAAATASIADLSASKKKKTNYLHDAYPVRFSSDARSGDRSPNYSVALKDEGALLRSLCIASNDPPYIAVASSRGIQQAVPASYMRAGKGYSSKSTSGKQVGNTIGRGQRIQTAVSGESFNDQQTKTDTGVKARRSTPQHAKGYYVKVDHTMVATTFINGIEATVLASHPWRSRFVTGGPDGVVGLWSFNEDKPFAKLKVHSSRIEALKYSAYAGALLTVCSNGEVGVIFDPDIYSSHRNNKAGNSFVLHAFENRRASDAVFLDERNTIAVIGDPGGTSNVGSMAVGHSLRVYDIRDRVSSSKASWSAKVHSGGEARCLALLEDRVRLASGGLEGSLSVLDLRTQSCIADLPAHKEEIVCLTMEQLRGRAIVSGCRDGSIKIWDARTLLQLDEIPNAHAPTRHFLSGGGFSGLVGMYGVEDMVLTDRSLISCGGDGLVKFWGPGWGNPDSMKD